MRNVLFAALVGLASAPALAQVTVEVTAPSIAFNAPPPLVEIGPGLQVVPGFSQEVFFVDGYYWTRQGDYWFRTKDYAGGWVIVEKDVPPVLLNLPKGKYRHYKQRERAAQGGEEPRAREERAQERDERKEEEAKAREERARERRERAERDRADRSSGKRGSEVFPGKNEISAHIGYQLGFPGAKFGNPWGFKLFAEYARRFSDLVWLDVQANNVFGVGPSTNTCYDGQGRPSPCGGFYYGGWNFELAIGVKLKIKTSIPLVVEIPLLAAVEVLYARQCGDSGAALALRAGAGVKYFVTKSIGIGGGVNFALGPGFHASSNCFGSYTDFFGAFDFQLGAEFIL